MNTFSHSGFEHINRVPVTEFKIVCFSFCDERSEVDLLGKLLQ